MPEASVVVLTYNAGRHVRACLDGLRRQTCSDFETIVIDNASSDGSAALVAACYPEVRLLRNERNLGYAAGCNRGLREARGWCLAVLGPDCTPEPEWLEALVRACRQPRAGLVTSMVRHHRTPELINACGNDIHLLGMGFCCGLDDPWAAHNEPGEVASISGCSFAMPRQVFERVGGFNETFFMYCEDTDLSLRTWAAGYRVLYVPSSVAYHRYRLDIQPLKFFLLERNRYLVLLGNLRRRTLLVILPGLLMGELMMWTYAILRGPSFVASKARSWAWLLTHRAEMKGIRKQRAGRGTGDGPLLRVLTARLSERQVLAGSRVSRALCGLANLFFRGVLGLARRLERRALWQ